MLHRVALVRTDVLEELSASIIRVTRIGELGTTLAVTSNQCMLGRNTKKKYVPPKCRFLQEPHSIIFQKTASFIVEYIFRSLEETLLFQQLTRKFPSQFSSD
jgi:hypothetical protein